MPGLRVIRPEDFDPVFREHYSDTARVTMFRALDDSARLRAVDPVSKRRAECEVPEELMNQVQWDERAAADRIFKLADGLVRQVTQPEPEPRPGIGRGEG